MNITRLFETPQGVPGVWAELDGGDLYHVIEGDPEPMAQEVAAAVKASGLAPEPVPEPEIGVSPVEQMNEELEAAGVGVAITDEADIPLARSYLRQRAMEIKASAFKAKFDLQEV